MPAQYPVNGQARDRLRDAQKAEADALRAVVAAQRTRDRQQERLNNANGDLDATLVKLVGISGAWRAAGLTGQDVKSLRQKARAAGLKPSQTQ